MANFSKICINKFRGINKLSLENLSDINIIVGDNNCGKTSILEAIQLLRNPSDITNLLRVAKLRDNMYSFGYMPIFDNFINMFPHLNDGINGGIDISCDYNTKPLSETNNIKFASIFVDGTMKKVLFDPSELKNDTLSNYYALLDSLQSNEMDEYQGIIKSICNGKEKTNNIVINKLSNITGRNLPNKDMIKIVYLSPIAHMLGSTFDRIIKNDKYKEICIKILQIFDPNISDLVLLKDDRLSRTVEYVRNTQLGLMPLSTYGDGIKKVLSIANAIAQSHDGILLIDEIDTAIHSKYYYDIFNFIVKAAKQYNIQLFIATQSIEAIDGLLNTRVQDNYYDTNNDTIRVITLRKSQEDNKTYSRILTGAEVHNNRIEFGFDVRI